MIEKATENVFRDFFPIHGGHFIQARTGLKPWLIMRPRETVPWAHILTNVAAKDPVFEFAFDLTWNFFFQFNGEIGNTLASVYDIGL